LAWGIREIKWRVFQFPSRVTFAEENMKKETVAFWKVNLMGGGVFIGLVALGVLSGGIGLLFLPVIGLPAAIAFVNDKKSKSQDFDMGEFFMILLFAGPFMAIIAGVIIIPFVLPCVVLYHVLSGKPLIDS
jgi:hypothetical protein